MEDTRKTELWNAMQKTNKNMIIFHKLAVMPPQIVAALKSIKRCGETHDGKVKTSVIAEELFLSRPATTHLVNDLEQKGYVERVMTPDDRRVVYLRLTPCGEEELVKGETQMKIFFDEIMERLGEGDTKELIRLQNKLSDIIIELCRLKD